MYRGKIPLTVVLGVHYVSTNISFMILPSSLLPFRRVAIEYACNSIIEEGIK